VSAFLLETGSTKCGEHAITSVVFAFPPRDSFSIERKKNRISYKKNKEFE
jgi:hypothetical protein